MLRSLSSFTPGVGSYIEAFDPERQLGYRGDNDFKFYHCISEWELDSFKLNTKWGRAVGKHTAHCSSENSDNYLGVII